MPPNPSCGGNPGGLDFEARYTAAGLVKTLTGSLLGADKGSVVTTQFRSREGIHFMRPPFCCFAYCENVLAGRDDLADAGKPEDLC